MVTPTPVTANRQNGPDHSDQAAESMFKKKKLTKGQVLNPQTKRTNLEQKGHCKSSYPIKRTIRQIRVLK